jgi:SAM-dependent methyltransferase
VLAEKVGPTGRVVGFDFNPDAVARAQAVVAELALDEVQVVVGELGTVPPEELGAPFDLAFTRCFLMHQPDTQRALTHVAQLLRPGGWIVSLEPLSEPPPMSHPPLPALRDYWELLHEVMGSLGVSPHTVAELPRAGRAAGLEVVVTSGSFGCLDAADGFELHAATLAAFRDRVLSSGAADAAAVDGILKALTEARSSDYDWVSSPVYLDVAFRKPE